MPLIGVPPENRPVVNRTIARLAKDVTLDHVSSLLPGLTSATYGPAAAARGLLGGELHHNPPATNPTPLLWLLDGELWYRLPRGRIRTGAPNPKAGVHPSRTPRSSLHDHHRRRSGSRRSLCSISHSA